MKKFIIIIVTLLCCSCHGYNIQYQPATSKVFPQETRLPQAIYKNDLREILQSGWYQAHNCHIIELGTLHVGGNSFVSQEDLTNRAKEIAANLGATHLLVTENHDEYVTTYTTNCYYGSCTTMPLNWRKPQGTYIALRADCSTPF